MAAVTWNKSAVRDVRPFFGAATLEEAVASSDIRLFEDAGFSAEEAFTIEPSDVEKLSVVVRPNIDPATLVSGSIKKGDLVLAVTATHAFLKKMLVVASVPASGKLPKEIVISPETLAELGGGGNIVINVALCLAKPQAKKAGNPFLVGHWISKKSFHIKLPKPAEDFEITPTTDEEWISLGYPAKTFYQAQYLGGFNDPADKDQQLAKVRIHMDVHNKLAVESNNKLAKAVMSSLAAQIIADVVAASLADWESSDEASPGSPLAAVLKRVNKTRPCTFEEFKTMAKEPGMPKLRALLHADTMSVRAITEG